MDSKSDIAISVKNVSKTFKIPHEKVSSLRGAAVSVFKKKSYEEFKALDDVSFEVKKGEFFGIIGRNGSGKSTLLKILAGIYHPDKGKVHTNGRISPFLELGIGFNPELSGRDNVYLNATVLGLTKKEIDEKFDSIVKFSELERFIDQKLKNYSSGMQVRLAFSVSIHANREILLMDEVLAVGDSNFQKKCLREFGRYKSMNKTVILVTHDIATIQKYCDRALLLRNGKIVKIGKAEEVGDEYIYQNMSDEEKRVLNEKNLKKDELNFEIEKKGEFGEWVNSESKFNNKYFTPIRLSCLNDSGRVNTGSFKRNENAWVEIECDIKEINNELTVGYAMYDSYENLLFWSYFTDSRFDKIDLLKKGKHILRSMLPPQILNEGEYKIEIIGGIHFKEWILHPGGNNPHIFVKIEGGLSSSHFWAAKRPGIVAPLIEWSEIIK